MLTRIPRTRMAWHVQLARRVSGTACGLTLAICLSGCGGGASAVVVEDAGPSLSDSPLTAAVWVQIEDQEKYAPENLRRLREEDPDLKSAAKWKAFYQDIVKPGFEREVVGKLRLASTK